MGGAAPPPRPIQPWRKIRGKQRCANPLCPAGFVVRDGHATLAIVGNVLSLSAGSGGLPFMQRGQPLPKVTFPLAGFTILPPRHRPPDSGIGGRLGMGLPLPGLSGASGGQLGPGLDWAGGSSGSRWEAAGEQGRGL